MIEPFHLLFTLPLTLRSAQLRKRWNAVHIANLLALRKSLMDTEHELPSLDPEGREEVARLRLDIHLCLFYWHARLFLGRPFLLDHQTTIRTTQEEQVPTSEDKHMTAGALLAQDSTDAAVNIIQLCNLIYNKIGLARASYATEFTSCRAAMLVLIAKGINDKKSTVLGELLDQGLQLIQHMALGQNQASSEARVIVALQRAITRLHRKSHLVASSNDALHDTLSHDHLKQWEMLWQQRSPADHSNDVEPSIEGAYVQQGTEQEHLASDALDQNGQNPFESDFDDLWSTIFNSQLNEFNLVNCAGISEDPPQTDRQAEVGGQPMFNQIHWKSTDGFEPDADAQH